MAELVGFGFGTYPTRVHVIRLEMNFTGMTQQEMEEQRTICRSIFTQHLTVRYAHPTYAVVRQHM